MNNSISNKTTSPPTDLFHQMSRNDEGQKTRQTPKKHHSNPRTRKLGASVLDFLHLHRPMNHLRNHDRQQQEEPSTLQPPIIKSPNIEQDTPTKLVTFASVFDSCKSEYDLSSNIETISEKDFNTMATDNQIRDPTTITTTETIEPYPFRSGLSASLPLSLDSTLDVNTPTHYTRKKIYHHFTHDRPEKLRQSLQNTDFLDTKTQQTSIPNFTIPPLTSSARTKIPKNKQQDSSNTGRTRAKLSRVTRFIQSFGRHSHENLNRETSNTKIHSPGRPTGLRPLSDLLY